MGPMGPKLIIVSDAAIFKINIQIPIDNNKKDI
jgi:hypothetical protein